MSAKTERPNRRERRVRLTFTHATGGATLLLGALLVGTVAFGTPRPDDDRLGLPPGGSNWVEQPAPTTLPTVDLNSLVPSDLIRALIGDQVMISHINFQGAPIAAGTFSGGTGIIGFEEGIVLSTGNIASIAGPDNLLDTTSTDNGMPGDPDLDDLIPGFTTFDATILEFDFECVNPANPDVSFQFVFASEEYNEYVFSSYNDVFAFFLNGENIALIPSSSLPVSIDNVNCGDPYDPPGGGNNCGLFINNDCSDLPGGSPPCTGPVATELDGLTTVFTAQGTIVPGVNHIKLAIADAGDEVYDSDVFIRGSSLSCELPPGDPVFDPPTPCDQTLTGVIGNEMTFDVNALATNGLEGQEGTVTATGVPTGAVFTPALPVTGQPALTSFAWTPGPNDTGYHTVTLTATDQLDRTTDCVVTLFVEAGTPFCMGTGCPCGNNSASGGCATSTGDGALLMSTGTSSVTADDLILTVSNAPPFMFSLFYMGPNVDCVAFGDGLRAVKPGPPTVGYFRFPVQNAGAAGVITQGPGIVAHSVNFGASGTIVAGDLWRFQAYFRDNAGPCGHGFNLSNGYQVSFTP